MRMDLKFLRLEYLGWKGKLMVALGLIIMLILFYFIGYYVGFNVGFKVALNQTAEAARQFTCLPLNPSFSS